MSMGCPDVFEIRRLVQEITGHFDNIKPSLDILDVLVPDGDVIVRDYSSDERFTFRCHEVKGAWMLTLTTGGTRVLQIEVSASQLEKIQHGLRVVDTREEV